MSGTQLSTALFQDRSGTHRGKSRLLVQGLVGVHEQSQILACCHVHLLVIPCLGHCQKT
jgi:hypothetical protein